MSRTGSAAILFADVEGSTALYERLGDAQALARIGPCLARMKAIGWADRAVWSRASAMG